MGKIKEKYLNTSAILLIMKAEKALKLIKQYQRELEFEDDGFFHKFLD